MGEKEEKGRQTRRKIIFSQNKCYSWISRPKVRLDHYFWLFNYIPLLSYEVGTLFTPISPKWRHPGGKKWLFAKWTSSSNFSSKSVSGCQISTFNSIPLWSSEFKPLFDPFPYVTSYWGWIINFFIKWKLPLGFSSKIVFRWQFSTSYSIPL